MNIVTFQAKTQLLSRKFLIEMVFNKTYQSIENQEQKRFLAVRFPPHLVRFVKYNRVLTA